MARGHITAQHLPLKQRGQHFVAQRGRARGRQRDAADDDAGAAAIQHGGARLRERSLSGSEQQVESRVERGGNVARQTGCGQIGREALNETASIRKDRIGCAVGGVANLRRIKQPAPGRHRAAGVAALLD